jgi:hypothetical protein
MQALETPGWAFKRGQVSCPARLLPTARRIAGWPRRAAGNLQRKRQCAPRGTARAGAKSDARAVSPSGRSIPAASAAAQCPSADRCRRAVAAPSRTAPCAAITMVTPAISATSAAFCAGAFRRLRSRRSAGRSAAAWFCARSARTRALRRSTPRSRSAYRSICAAAPSACAAAAGASTSICCCGSCAAICGASMRGWSCRL